MSMNSSNQPVPLLRNSLRFDPQDLVYFEFATLSPQMLYQIVLRPHLILLFSLSRGSL